MFIVKVPCINGLGKTKGCEKAGNAIIESLKTIYSNESGRPVNTELLDLEEIHVDNFQIKEANELIFKNAFETFETKTKVVFLGGDHSISYSTGKAFLEYCKKENKEPCLVVFDAHPDCMEPIDPEIPTHEEWLRALIESGFPSENILLVGVRNQDPKEINFLSKNRIKTIHMDKLFQDLENVCDTIMEFASGKEFYLSLDIDIVDPVFAPGTSYSEPGGLTSRELIYLVQRINKVKSLKAVDIVEVNPEGKGGELTVKLGAKILSEFL